jgi:hypothetical protein
VVSRRDRRRGDYRPSFGLRTSERLMSEFNLMSECSFGDLAV